MLSRVVRCIAVVDDLYFADPDAVTSYLRAGAGVAYAFDKIGLFADMGYIGGGGKDKGLAYSTGTALNDGFLFNL